MVIGAIRAADGHRVEHVYEDAGSRGVVLLLHGITSDKDEGGLYPALAAQLRSAGLSSLRIDFRGHGKSAMPSTDATLTGMCLDLESAYRHLQADHAEISVVAASFGASVLLVRAAIGDWRFHRAALLNPVSDYVSTFTDATTPWAPGFLPQRDLTAALEASPIAIAPSGFLIGPSLVAELHLVPLRSLSWASSDDLLLIHGTGDQIVSHKDSVRFLAERVVGTAEGVYLEGAGHGLVERRREVVARLVDHLTSQPPR